MTLDEIQTTTQDLVMEAQRLAKAKQFAAALELVADIQSPDPKFQNFKNQLRLRAAAQKQARAKSRKRLAIALGVIAILIIVAMIAVPIMYRNIVREALDTGTGIFCGENGCFTLDPEFYIDKTRLAATGTSASLTEESLIATNDVLNLTATAYAIEATDGGG